MRSDYFIFSVNFVNTFPISLLYSSSKFDLPFFLFIPSLSLCYHISPSASQQPTLKYYYLIITLISSMIPNFVFLSMVFPV